MVHITILKDGEVVASFDADSFTVNAETMPQEKEEAKNGNLITQPQVRALYAAMHQRGKSGDEAREELKRQFNVEKLEDIGKGAASRWLRVNLKQ